MDAKRSPVRQGLTVGTQWSVYNISGTLVYTSKAADTEADVTLPVQGIYVIVSEQQSLFSDFGIRVFCHFIRAFEY